MSEYKHCTDCDTCGSITLVREIEGGGVICQPCDDMPEGACGCGAPLSGGVCVVGCDEYEDDGQPTEYEEWQDVYGGDDWDHGQFDNEW